MRDRRTDGRVAGPIHRVVKTQTVINGEKGAPGGKDKKASLFVFVLPGDATLGRRKKEGKRGMKGQQAECDTVLMKST